jgi:hypothetical protein
MRKEMKAILIAWTMAVTLLAMAGTAWARSDTIQCGTVWTDVEETTPTEPTGVSWELANFAF